MRRTLYFLPYFQRSRSSFKFSGWLYIMARFALIYDQDSKLPANLKKANKLTRASCGNNKQSVNLALSIFHESTIAGSKSYFPERKDNSGALYLIRTRIVNSRDRFCSNQLVNAVFDGDGITDFFLSFAVVK